MLLSGCATVWVCYWIGVSESDDLADMETWLI